MLLHEADQCVHCDSAAACGSNDDGVDVELEESINICCGVAGAGQGDLYERRDLKATTDLRAVLKGVLKDHLRVDDRALAADVFPGSEAVTPMAGLMA